MTECCKASLAEARKYLANDDQLCYARQGELTEGTGRGQRIVDVFNGTGLAFTVTPDLKALGLSKISRATDLMTAPDPDYQWLFEQRKLHRIPNTRAPLDLGDFGSRLVGTAKDHITVQLNHHCFSLVLIEE